MEDKSAEFYSGIERLALDFAALLESEKQLVSEDAIINLVLRALFTRPEWVSQIANENEWRAKLRPAVRRGIERWKHPTKL